MSECSEAADELADVKAAIKALTTGTRVTAWRHGDKSMDFYAGGNYNFLLQERRRLQAIVDRCNGVASKNGPFIQNTPSDC